MGKLGSVIAVGVLALLGGCSQPRPAAATAEGVAVTIPATDLAGIRARLAAHRAEQVEHLREYAAGGQFPHNVAAPVATHIFRDEAGRLCAVANLVQTDGHAELVDATARTKNDLAVADVHDGPMIDWAVGSGLTQEELVRIQFPSQPFRTTWREPVVARKPAKPAVAAEPKAAPAPDPAVVAEAELKAHVRSHLATVLGELDANREDSLDLAVARYLAAQYLAAARTPS